MYYVCMCIREGISHYTYILSIVYRRHRRIFSEYTGVFCRRTNERMCAMCLRCTLRIVLCRAMFMLPLSPHAYASTITLKSSVLLALQHTYGWFCTRVQNQSMCFRFWAERHTVLYCQKREHTQGAQHMHA